MWDSGDGRALPELGSVSPPARVEARLALRLVREDGSQARRVDLPGRPLDAALRAFTELLEEAGLQVPEDLRLPDYDLPSSGILAGAPFSAPDPAALAELGAWFDFGTRVLEELSASRLAGAEVRVWPHHFDVAALRTLGTAPGGEEARWVGAGLSPGDELYSEPDFYVPLTPAPPAAELPVLPGHARWHTGVFTGAILTASDVLADAADAPARTRATLDACVRTCLEIVGA